MVPISIIVVLLEVLICHVLANGSPVFDRHYNATDIASRSDDITQEICTAAGASTAMPNRSKSVRAECSARLEPSLHTRRNKDFALRAI